MSRLATPAALISVLTHWPHWKQGDDGDVCLCGKGWSPSSISLASYHPRNNHGSMQPQALWQQQTLIKSFNTTIDKQAFSYPDIAVAQKTQLTSARL